MAGTSYDLIIGSYGVKVVRTEQGGYRRRFVRREIQQQLLSQSETPAIQSRSDRAALYQTSWSGGATWWKPLLSPNAINTYFRGNHLDLWSEPGKVKPWNKLIDAAETNIQDQINIGVNSYGRMCAIGSTSSTAAGKYDLYYWDDSSDAFVRDTTQSTGITNTRTIHGMTHDPSDGYFYVIHTKDNAIFQVIGAVSRFKYVAPSGLTTDRDEDFVSLSNVGFGSNIFTTQEGVMFYDSDKLYLLDKATPASDEKFDDGLGPDWLSTVETGGTNPLLNPSVRLALNTPEGIYYVKNNANRGVPQPWVFRVERDASGSYIGNPIATLPLGSVALSIGYHMGQVVVSTSPDWASIQQNDTDEAEVVLYFVGAGGMGALGSVLGNASQEADETPYALIGSSGPYLYIGGQKRLWIYDSVRGGLHSAFEWTTELNDGPYKEMFFNKDSAGDPVAVFMGTDRIVRTKLTTDDPDTVTAFGDDEAHYTLESNYFDFGMPMETKELTKVEIMTDALDATPNQEWTVQVSADDGAFADVLATSDASATYHSADLNGTTGRRFRYKLIYQTKDTERIALRSLKFTATSGENVQEWHLLLDGDEILNVDNEVQDEQQFYDDMVALGGTETTTTLIDNMQEQAQEEDDSGSGIRVKVVSVDIIKEKPGESLVQLVLRED